MLIKYLPFLMVACVLFFAEPDAQGQFQTENFAPKHGLSYLSAKIEENPRDPQAYIDRAHFFYDRLMFARARKDLSASIVIHPKSEAYFWTGKMALEEDGPKKATEIFEKSFQLAKGESLSFVRLGIVYGTMRLYDKADVCYEQAILLDPNNLQIIDWRARNAMLNNKCDQAMKGATYVLAHIKPVTPGKNADRQIQYNNSLRKDASRTRGLALSKMHRDKESLADLNVAISLAPLDAVLLTARSDVYRRLGKPELADKDMKTLKGSKDFIFENAPFAHNEK